MRAVTYSSLFDSLFAAYKLDELTQKCTVAVEYVAIV